MARFVMFVNADVIDAKSILIDPAEAKAREQTGR
jgi:hypothetical protein